MTTRRPRIIRNAALLSLGIMPAGGALAQDVPDRVLEDVSAETDGQCSRVTIGFADRIQYRDATVEGQGSEARLRVDTQSARSPPERESLAPPAGTPLVRSISYERDAVGPVLSVTFARDVHYRVTLGPQGRSVVLLLSDIPGTACASPAPAPLGEADRATLAQLEADAEAAIVDRRDAAALEMLGRMLAYPDNEFTPRALELTGLVQARNGRTEEARRSFQDHLARVPADPGRSRVEQRLAAIEGPAREQAAAARAGGTLEEVEKGWKTDLRGVISQFYYRDESHSEIVDARRPDVDEIIDNRLNVDQILNSIDATLETSKGDTRIAMRGSGQATFDYRPVSLVAGVRGGGDTERITNLYVEVEDGGSGLAARVGRQWLTTSGVFGRFDGANLGVDVTSNIRLGAVAGFPVQTPRDTHVDDDRYFYALSVDVAWPDQNLETGIYWLDQRSHGLTDRRAIGLTARYSKDKLNVFGIVDYDIHFNRLSSAYVALNYMMSEKTSVTLTADYFHYPQLTTTSAILGQPEPDLDIVKQRFDRDFIKQLAKDRSQAYRSVAVTWSQVLSPTWQLNTDFTVTRTSSAPASGGAREVEGSGTEFYTGAQLVGTDLLMKGDTMTFGMRYADVAKFKIVAADIGAFFPVTDRLRIDPRIRAGYRDDKIGTGRTWNILPSIRAVYRLTSSTELDFEAGRNWIDQNINDPVTSGSKDETSWYVNFGYRFSF